MSSKIQQYLREYGWTFQPISEFCLITGWQGKNARFPLEININDTWIQFKIKPLMKLEFRGKPTADIARYLLQLNLSTRLVKLAMEKNGEIEVSLEVFQYNFDYEQFCRSIGILGYYADAIFEEIVMQYSKVNRHKLATTILC